ncbi:MAG: multiubiquitin domain-containing protein [Chthoniobacterales bacterium]|nr:multiubiquitin domain-containing protein [Chthoniobacterales bacterium]
MNNDKSKHVEDADDSPFTPETDETVDLEEYAKSNRKPPRARRYRIRVDKNHYEVEAPAMTGRELLTLAGKTPVTGYMISQKMRGGEAHKIGYDERADFTTPGVERFMTLPLDQTEGQS